MVDKIAWLVVGAVVAVWIGTTLVLPFFVNGYAPPPSVGTVMGSLAGGAAAFLFAKRAEKKDDDEPKPKPKPKPTRQRPRR